MTGPIVPELTPAERLNEARKRDIERTQRLAVPPVQTPVVRLREAHDLARDTVPTQAARVLRVQGQTAFPTDFVERNLEVLEKQVTQPDFDADAFWKSSPQVAAWLSQDPARVAATGRDIQRMGSVERYLKAIGTEFERSKATVEMTQPAIRAALGVATEADEQYLTELDTRVRSLPRLGPENYIAGIPVAVAGQLPVWGQLFAGSAKGIAIGAAGGAVIGAARAAPTGTPQAIGISAAAGAVRGGALGQTAGALSEAWQIEFAQGYLEYRKLPADGRAAARAASAAFEANAPEPDIIPIDNDTAVAGAILYATMASALEMLPFDDALKRVPGLRAFTRDGVRQMLANPSMRRVITQYVVGIGRQLLAEGTTEGLQEFVLLAGKRLTQLASEGSLTLLSPATVIREVFGDRESMTQIVSAAVTGSQAGAGMSAVSGGATAAYDWRKLRRAEENARRASAAADAIHGNPSTAGDSNAPGGTNADPMTMAKDAPESMREAIAAMGSEGGYYDINAFTAYWQEQRTPDGEVADPKQVALALGVTDAEWNAAVETGAPINIPADKLLVDGMATPEHRQWFADNLRATPNEFSKAEAMQERERLTKEAEAVAEVGDVTTREAEAEAGLEAFTTRLTEELRGTRMVGGDVEANVALWREAAATAIARNPNIPVADVLAKFERVSVAAQPVAVTPEGRAVSVFQTTGEMMARGDGVQVPVLRSTRAASQAVARFERRMQERYGAMPEVRMTPKEREQYDQLRQVRVDAEKLNLQLAPFPTIAELRERGGAALQSVTDPALSPEERAALNVAVNADVLEQAAFHGTPHIFKGEVEITRANGRVETYELGGRFPAEVEAEIRAGTATAKNFPGGKFRLSAIGTGEGAQAYGWGLYFAESQGVAEGYRKTLSGSIVKSADGTPLSEVLDNDPTALKILGEAEQDTDLNLREYATYLRTTARTSREYAALGSMPSENAGYAEAAEKVANLFESGAVTEKAGALYRVDIPDDAVARMLDWDKPLSEEQIAALTPESLTLTLDDSNGVFRYLGPNGIVIGNMQRGGSAESFRRLWQKDLASAAKLSGGDAYRFLANGLFGPGAREASLTLLAAGIPGIKYLDAGSRTATWSYEFDSAFGYWRAKAVGQIGPRFTSEAEAQSWVGEENRKIEEAQTRNLVVFDENLVTITQRNGEPVTAQERADFLEQGQGEPTVLQAELDDVAERIKQSTGVDRLELRVGGRGDVRLETIGVRVAKQGAGTRAMEQLVAWADNSGIRLTLAIAEMDYQAVEGGPRTSSIARLERFYRRFGFVSNTGRRRDFALSDDMYRDPKPATNILEQGPRGAFIPPAGARTPSGARIDGPRLVALFNERNRSTFLHESSHAFLDIWASLADDPNVNPEFRDRYQALRSEIGADPETGTLSVAQEEAFAGMFLDYLKSGKAPSLTLRRAFAAFANWLTKLWSLLQGEIVPANQEVRDILDRMLATDDAIATAQGEFMAPLFPQDLAINEAFVAARTEAEEKTRKEAMLTIVRAEQEWWAKERAKTKEEVTDRVMADPAYVARAALTAGTLPDGTPLEGLNPLRERLNREQVVAAIGTERTKALPRGRTAVYNTQGGGLDLAFAAQLLGYDTGVSLLEAIEATRPVDEHIDALTDATMREKYGDPMTDGSIPEVAIETLHNASLDKMRQLEIEAIRRDHPEAFRDALVAAASRPLNVREVMEFAKEHMAPRPLKSIRPAEYLTAERTATKEAVKAVAEGRWADAVRAKGKQRLAAAMYAEAVAIKEERAKAQKLFAKVYRPDDSIVKSRNLDIVQVARTLLAHVGLGRRQESTQFYLSQLEEYDPQTAADMQAVIADVIDGIPPREQFTALTVAEFRDVRDTIQYLWDASRQAETIEVAGKRITLEAARQPMVDKLATMDATMEGAGLDRKYGTMDHITKGLLTARAVGRRVEAWVDAMDGGDPDGPFRQAIFATARRKTAEKTAANTADLKAYDELLQAVRPSLSQNPIAAKELGRGLWVWDNTAHLLRAMLHRGNPSNFEMMLAGRGWTKDQWLAMEDRLVAEGVLKPEHMEFVQGVWNLFESKKAEAQRVYKRTQGKFFAEVTRESFVINWPDGPRTYAGGYTPASKDPDASGLAERRNAEAKFEESYGFRMPTVQKGFTIRRVANAEPLLLSLDIVKRHLDAVNKFIHLTEVVRDVRRLLSDREFRDAMYRVDRTAINEMLIPWLQRVSTQVVEKPFNKYVDAGAKYLRETAGAGFMFLNIRNTIEQVTGFSVASVRVNSRYLSLAQAKLLQDPEGVNELVEQDNPFMAERVFNRLMDASRSIEEIVKPQSALGSARNYVREHAYFLQAGFQSHIDRVVWYGSYLEGLDNGMTAAQAREKANTDVRLTQGSFDAIDVSRIETGTPVWRMFAMFAGYFNMLANLNATEMQKAVDTMGLKKSMPRLLYIYTMGFAVPILFSDALRLGFRGFQDIDGEDDWGYLDDFMSWFFGSQFRAATAMVPAGGSTVQALANMFDDNVMNDQISVSPAISFLESSFRGSKQGYDLLTGEELKRRGVRDMLSLLSLMTRVPVAGLSNPATYLFDVESGRANPSGPFDFTRGLMSGAPGR